ncbi:MAG: carboxymuconolactone decarboxylase family protein [Acetobacteraceae bacterium]
MQARMHKPAIILLDAVQATLALDKMMEMGSVPCVTRKLVELRANQIKGCSLCADMHSRELRVAGKKHERIFAVAAWRSDSGRRRRCVEYLARECADPSQADLLQDRHLPPGGTRQPDAPIATIVDWPGLWVAHPVPLHAPGVAWSG